MTRLLDFTKNNWIALTLFSLAAIAAASFYPLPKLPPVPGTDKTHHLIAYAVLMFPTAVKRPRRWKFIALCFIAFSGVVELLQPYVNRYGEWLDLAANTAGIICGLLIAELMLYVSRSYLKMIRKSAAG